MSIKIIKEQIWYAIHVFFLKENNCVQLQIFTHYLYFVKVDHIFTNIKFVFNDCWNCTHFWYFKMIVDHNKEFIFRIQVSWYGIMILALSNLHICGPSSVIKIVKMKYNRTDVIWSYGDLFQPHLNWTLEFIHPYTIFYYNTISLKTVYIYSCSS